MKAYLLTSDDCQPCAEIKADLADVLATGEIQEVNLEKEPEKVTELVNKYSANIPSLLIVTDDGQLIVATS